MSHLSAWPKKRKLICFFLFFSSPDPLHPPFHLCFLSFFVCFLFSPALCGRTLGGRWRGRSAWKRCSMWGCVCPASCCWRCCTAGTSAPSFRRSSAAASTTTPSSSTSTWPSTCTTWVSVPLTLLFHATAILFFSFLFYL